MSVISNITVIDEHAYEPQPVIDVHVCIGRAVNGETIKTDYSGGSLLGGAGRAGSTDKMSERIKHGKVRRARRGRLAGGGRCYGMPGLAPTGRLAARRPARDGSRRGGSGRAGGHRGVLPAHPGRGTAAFAGPRSGPARAQDSHRRTRNGLRQMLDRPVLAGLLTHIGTVVGRLPGAEPIIKAGEWERLSAILAGRPRGRPVADVHVLTNTMACGTCGHLMQGTTRASLPPRSRRTRYRLRGRQLPPPLHPGDRGNTQRLPPHV
jgi:hypothetical protein